MEAALSMEFRLFICGILSTGLLSVAANSAEVHMIAPEIPPHFDQNGDGRIGDIIRETLYKCGHRVKFTMVPFGRHWKDYEANEEFDGLATAEANQTFAGFATESFVHLQDGATVIAGSGLETIESITELEKMRIVAFPNAGKILGIELLVPKFKSFKERADRFDQIRPLFAGRADAILADGLITAHFISTLRANASAGNEPDVDVSQTVVFRRIFAKGPQRLYFRDEAITRDFDRCYNELLANGDVDRITGPYVERYRKIVGDQYPKY